MRYWILCLGVFVVIMAPACRSVETETELPDEEVAQQEPDMALDANATPPSLPDTTYARRIEEIMEAGRSFGTSLQALRENLGEPIEIVRVDTTNRHTGEPDTVLYVQYVGLEVELYRVGASGRDLLSSVTLTGNEHASALPIQIGDTRSEILSYLGKPFNQQDAGQDSTRLEYETIKGPTTNTLLLWLQNERLERLKMSYYLD